MFTMVLYACATQLRVPTEADAQRGAARWASYDSLQLYAGYKKYITKCSSCHSLYKPEQFTLDKWASLYPEMAQDARLDSSEKELVWKYIVVMQESKLYQDHQSN